MFPKVRDGCQGAPDLRKHCEVAGHERALFIRRSPQVSVRGGVSPLTRREAVQRTSPAITLFAAKTPIPSETGLRQARSVEPIMGTRRWDKVRR
jgi:hypothetical protein